MWFRQKVMDIVCGPELRHRTYEYAQRIADATWGRVPDGISVWEFITEKRDPFLKAARKELGIFDESLNDRP